MHTYKTAAKTGCSSLRDFIFVNLIQNFIKYSERIKPFINTTAIYLLDYENWYTSLVFNSYSVQTTAVK
jgi:hypothetical protein